MNLFWVGAFWCYRPRVLTHIFEIYYRMFPFLGIAAFTCVRESTEKNMEKRLDPVSEARELELHHQKVTRILRRIHYKFQSAQLLNASKR